jgi:hypothetical protein
MNIRTKLLEYGALSSRDIAELEAWSPHGSADFFNLQIAIARNGNKTLCYVPLETINSAYFVRAYIVRPGLNEQETFGAGDSIDATLAAVGQERGIRKLIMPVPVAADVTPSTVFRGVPCAVRMIPESMFFAIPSPIAAQDFIN